MARRLAWERIFHLRSETALGRRCSGQANETEASQWRPRNASALGHYTGVSRDTKDFDLMLRSEDVPIALQACRNAGYGAEYAFTHWLAKIWSANSFIDVIFRAGNGLAEVDLWFSKAPVATVLGISVKLAPPRGIDLAEGLCHGT
jgi:hypothetical protein